MTTNSEKLNDKLIKIISELKVPKSQYNDYGGFAFRSAEDILNAVKPLLQREGILLTISDQLENIGERYYIKATVRLELGEEVRETVGYAREEETKKGMDGSQITGASSSYARKYALNGMFCIDDTKDSDATNTGTKNTRNTQSDITEAIKKLRTAKTLDELKSIYIKLPNQVKGAQELQKEKEQLKAKLSKGED